MSESSQIDKEIYFLSPEASVSHCRGSVVRPQIAPVRVRLETIRMILIDY